MLFVSFNGSIQINNSDYRKFKATSTILPGVATVKDSSSEDTQDAPREPDRRRSAAIIPIGIDPPGAAQCTPKSALESIRCKPAFGSTFGHTNSRCWSMNQ